MNYTDPTGLYEYKVTGEDLSLNVVRSLMEQSGHDDLIIKASSSRDRDADGHSSAYSYVSDKAKDLDKALKDAGQNFSDYEKGEVLDFDDDFVNSLLGIDSQIKDNTAASDISSQGASFIANYEKFEASSYLDAGNKATIGYTKDIVKGLKKIHKTYHPRENELYPDK